MPGRCQTLLVALALDLSVAELPNALHPVVAMGRWLTLGERLAPSNELARLLWGAGWFLGGLGLSVGMAARGPRDALAEGVIAQTLLAYRTLDRTVGEVQTALANDDLPAARRLLGWHLVSRPTDNLDHAEVAAAAIESLAENLSDSLIAPLCWFLVGGLPALTAYRFSNTADAMWGYRNARYEHLGKVAARCDDVLNFVPARLTAVLLALAAQLTKGRGRWAWCIAQRDHARTASPNAGWPMAAMAGALDTTLVKVGYYRLGNGSQQPDVVMIGVALRIARSMIGIVMAVLVLGASGKHFLLQRTW
jgi:adenosylcobinamide-phosphate synthase